MTTARMAALGGILGPAAFISAWAVGGASRSDYSPIEDAISRLAAVDASTRPLMTTGFVLFGVGVPLYAQALRRAVPGHAWKAATATGIATLAVAAFPLDASPTVDTLHTISAATGYATLALTPLLAAGPLADAGHRTAARVSTAVGTVCALSLAATVLGPKHGFFQRAGLTVGDTWLATSAVLMLAGRRLRRSSEPAI